eukprot:5889045-Heterocapsa_arctica.AAC.1
MEDVRCAHANRRFLVSLLALPQGDRAAMTTTIGIAGAAAASARDTARHTVKRIDRERVIAAAPARAAV